MTDKNLKPLSEILREKVANMMAAKLIENPSAQLDMPPKDVFGDILESVIREAIHQRDLKEMAELVHNAIGLLVSTVMVNYVKVSTITRGVDDIMSRLANEGGEPEEVFSDLLSLCVGAASSGLLRGHDDLPRDLLVLLKFSEYSDDQAELP